MRILSFRLIPPPVPPFTQAQVDELRRQPRLTDLLLGTALRELEREAETRRRLFSESLCRPVADAAR